MAVRHHIDGEGKSHSDPDNEPLARRSSSGVILAIIVIAVILAIGAMMMFPDRQRNDQGEAAIQAAQTLDRGATAVGDAAASAAEKLKNGN
ncbi:hypothetical protein PX699_19055 [Sphingobium sp. H39-3-25]|uniref:hypothetical protein n=1 Tax=Sphingobium arseniciresistens TaxID=3030834 RepID=UPI0023B96184|nr:hypothetical protein [Sphingobium arseniciresistens]